MTIRTRQLDDTVTLPKREHLHLKQQAQAYRAVAAKVFESPLRDPAGEVVADFRSTDLYAEEFLTDLEDGLRKSSYGRNVNQQFNAEPA